MSVAPGTYQEMAASVPPALRAITLTHVRYTKGDKVGLLLAWVSLVPVFISFGGFITHFLFRRDLQGICFAAGLLVSQFLNELIKRSVAQSRPASCEVLETCDSLGWPSSHAQFVFFFATYLSLLVLRRSTASRVMTAVTWPFAFLTMLSRVYLGYHTVEQVFAGAVAGLVFGATWYWIANTILIGYFPMIEESTIGRWLYIKDTSHIPNVLKFEYDNARAARKKVATD